MRVSDQLLAGPAASFTVPTRDGFAVGLVIQARWALDRRQLLARWEGLPADPGPEVVGPVLASAFRAIAPEYDAPSLLASKREELATRAAKQAGERLAEAGIVLKDVLVSDLKLPIEFERGRLALLEQAQLVERTEANLRFKKQEIEQQQLEAEARKARSDKEAEASANRRLIEAKAEADAMTYILPLKEKGIKQQELEAEAQKARKLKDAQSQSETMKIQAEAEASRRRTMADAEAYAIRQTSLAQFENLKREVELIEKNPTWVNKTLAEKLGDKVQVIVMPNLTADILAPGWASASRTATPRSLRGKEREREERRERDFYESEEGHRPRGRLRDRCCALPRARSSPLHLLRNPLSSSSLLSLPTPSSQGPEGSRNLVVVGRYLAADDTRLPLAAALLARGAARLRAEGTPDPRAEVLLGETAERLAGRPGAAPEGVSFAAPFDPKLGRNVRVYDGEAFRRVLADVPADAEGPLLELRERALAGALRARFPLPGADARREMGGNGRLADFRRVRPDAARRRRRLAPARARGPRTRTSPPRGRENGRSHGPRPPIDRREPASRGARARPGESPPPARRGAVRPAPPRLRRSALSPGGLAHARARRRGRQDRGRDREPRRSSSGRAPGRRRRQLRAASSMRPSCRSRDPSRSPPIGGR